MVRLTFVSAFLVLLLFSVNGCDHGNNVESEVPQQDFSDNPLISLVEDLRKIPVMAHDVFSERVVEIHRHAISPYYRVYAENVRSVLDINKENLRHREEILELIFSKDIMSNPEVVVALRHCLDEVPVSDIRATHLKRGHASPPGYYEYLAELAADNNRHREFFIKKLRCFEIDQTAVVE